MDVEERKVPNDNPGREEDPSKEKTKESISSKAIVKFASVHVPSSFSQLKCNTNLNLPPSRWRNSLDDSYGMQRRCTPLGFSSFRMSHMFPDCIGGDVDVVSSAENIKRLLKLPYSFQNSISMIVHRVGSTLLIDDFDVHKYLLNQSKEDWKWLRSFIAEKIMNSLSENDKKLLITGNNQNVLKDGTLMAKFLKHSLSEEDSSDKEPSEESSKIPAQFYIPCPVLPEPKLEEPVINPSSSHKFNRNVLWNFEDIRMLIGTDLPIFGGATRPCISLRLRDSKEPINVLTGIDYWLDNLMCNVPEVVMCYHLDGIVQKYELLKTEDLPNLENSKFSPKVIKNVAQNILAFLQQNATKAGHTYWLFKGPKDEVVKLYDLTTLCGAQNDVSPPSKEAKTKKSFTAPNPDENPFTVPVAMLLYSVARNMKMSKDKLTSKQAGSIKALLDNCIKLLPKEKYPQIVTSSHYMLSDLFVPTGLDPSNPNFPNSDEDSDSIYEDFEDMEMDDTEEEEEVDFFDSDLINKTTVSVQNIQDTLIEKTNKKNSKNNNRPPELSGSLEKRCQESLDHIIDGLRCLKYFQTKSEEETQKEKKDRIIKEEQNLNMARPHQPIPLPYESLQIKGAESQILTKESEPSKGKGKKSKKPNVDLQMSTSLFIKETSSVVKSWDVHLKLLLLEKACLTYATLAENSYALGNFGISLRYIALALNCQKAVVNHLSSLQFQKCCLWGRAGDCYFQFVKNFNQIEKFKEAFNVLSDVDKEIMKEIQDYIKIDDKEEVLEPMPCIQELLVTSKNCYETAINLSKSTTLVELLRRLANIQNELGMKYMYDAQEGFNRLEQNTRLQDSHREMIDKSAECFKFGIGTFEKFNDVVNHALVASNMGRLHRLQAHVALKELDETIKLEVCGQLYDLACSYYQKALSALESRKANPTLWEMITWELSTATYTIAKLFFENRNDVKNGIEKTVNLLQIGLKYCDMDDTNVRHEEYLLRAGEINFMLGGVHENLLRVHSENEKKKRSLIHLCLLHYDKAIMIYDTLDRLYEFLNVAAFKIEFVELLIQQNTGIGPRIKCLNNLFDVIYILIRFLERNRDHELMYIGQAETIRKLLIRIEEQTKSILIGLIKHCQTSVKNSKSKENQVVILKKLFAGLLRNSKENIPIQDLVQVLINNFKKLHSDFGSADLF